MIPSNKQEEKKQEESIVKSFDWHKYKFVFSVATQDDVVNHFNFYSSEYMNPQLKDEKQVNIQIIKWSPSFPNKLAVGCDGGICIWDHKKKEHKFENEKKLFDSVQFSFLES